MQMIEVLELHSEGTKDGVSFSPSFVPSAVLKSALRDIPDFVAGSKSSQKTKSLVESSLSYSFENGSLVIKATVAAALAATLQQSGYYSDFEAISCGKLENVNDAGRIEAVQDLKRELMENGATVIELASEAAHVSAFDLTKRDVKPPPTSDPIVDSESYVMATVVDIGGKVKANAHLELENGKVIMADSARNYLAGLEDNLLYKKVLAHVSYRVNLRTGEWQDIRLTSLSLPSKPFDGDAFDKAVSGPSAWDDVDDPVAEVRRMRGDDA